MQRASSPPRWTIHSYCFINGGAQCQKKHIQYCPNLQRISVIVYFSRNFLIFHSSDDTQYVCLFAVNTKTNVFQRETFNDFFNESLFPQNSHLHSKRKVNTQKVLSILEIALLFKTFLKALKVATNLPNLFWLKYILLRWTIFSRSHQMYCVLN